MSTETETDGKRAGLIAGGVTCATTLVIAFAFNPIRGGTAPMLLAMGGLYLALALGTVMRLKSRGELRDVFRPVAGDVTLGTLVAAVLYGAGMATRIALTPHGSPREAWMIRLHLQMGDPALASELRVGLAVFAIAALEEIVWRGLVMRSLEPRLGSWRAVLVSSALFAVAHLPTAFLLADPVAGLNPLVVAAAFGCSVVWGYMLSRTGRLVPGIIAHALFSSTIVSFPIWRP